MKNNQYQTNYELGKKVQKRLIEFGIENPVNHQLIKQWSNEKHLDSLAKKLIPFLENLGIYSNHEDSSHTANRLVDYWCNQLFYGLDYNYFPQINLMPNEFAYHNPLIAENIKFTSTCEHHLVPIHGVAIIAYKPDSILVGLNKLNSVLDFFVHRPQLQERLVKQIFISLQYLLKTENIAILIKARHDCICSNGISDLTSTHTTFELGGVFDTDAVLKENLLNKLMKQSI